MLEKKYAKEYQHTLNLGNSNKILRLGAEISDIDCGRFDIPDNESD